MYPTNCHTRLTRRLHAGERRQRDEIGVEGSIYRRLALIVLAIAVVGLIAVPFALAAEPTMVVGGLVHGKCYSGTRTMAAIVAVPTRVQPRSRLTRSAHSGDRRRLLPDDRPASWEPSHLREPDHHVHRAFAGVGRLVGSLSTGTSSFENIPGGAEGVSLTMVVKNTTVSGVVKSAKTKKAIKGVKVTVGNKSATTNAKGAYKIVIGLWRRPSTRHLRLEGPQEGDHDVHQPARWKPRREQEPQVG